MNNIKVVEKKDRVREIDFLRGFAIILVVLGHSFIVHPVDIHEVPWCVSLHEWIYSFHMELFFLLCGTVYCCKSYPSYLKNKFERILVPYLFFGVISLLLHVIGLDVVNKNYSMGGGIIKLLFYGGSYWFLYTLFIVFLFYPLIEKICKQPWMEILFAVICACICEFLDVTHFLNLNRFFYYIPFFVTGRFAMRFIKSDAIRNHWINVILFLLSLLINSALSYLCNGLDSYFIKFIKAICMCGTLLVIARYCIILIDKGAKILSLIEKLLMQCSKYSLQLYLFNGFILVAIRTIVVSILHIHNPFVIVTSIVAGNILITLLICNYLLPHTKWLSWLCGTGKTKS